MAKEDLRVIRTRKLLSSALKELLQEKSFDKITVNDICDRAMVHRATFYNHFIDKMDLLNYLFDEMQEEVYQKVVKLDNFSSSKEMYIAIISKIIDYVDLHRQEIKLILKNSTREFQMILFETIKRGIFYLASKCNDGSPYEEILDEVISFFTGGFSRLCIELVLSDKPIKKDMILTYLKNVLDMTISSENEPLDETN